MMTKPSAKSQLVETQLPKILSFFESKYAEYLTYLNSAIEQHSFRLLNTITEDDQSENEKNVRLLTVLQAIRAGSLRTADCLNVDLNRFNGLAFLGTAIYNGNSSSAMKILLEHSVNYKDYKNYALVLAAAKSHYTVMDFLMTKGASKHILPNSIQFNYNTYVLNKFKLNTKTYDDAYFFKKTVIQTKYQVPLRTKPIDIPIKSTTIAQWRDPFNVDHMVHPRMTHLTQDPPSMSDIDSAMWDNMA